MRSASVGFQCPDCVREGARAVRTPRAVGAPRVTQVLLGLNVVLFVLTGLGGGSGLFARLALQPYAVALNGEYERLLTSMFLHFGIIHIALNMYCLYAIGPALEAAVGRLRFAGLYLLSGLAGSAASYAFGAANEQAAGASGAVFGLFAALFVLQRRRGGDVSAIAVTIGLNLVLGFTASSIDVRAHLGGLVAGGVVAAALLYAPRGRQRHLVQALGGAAVALVVVALVVLRTAALTA